MAYAGTMDRIEDNTLGDIASEVKFAWQKLAEILDFGWKEIEAIEVAWADQRTDQAVHMLTVWRDERYDGVDAKGCLIGALRILERYDILHKLGAESFDDNALKKLASGVGDAWPELAGLLRVDFAAIITNYPGKPDCQAGCMLGKWRTDYQGIDMITCLTEALKRMGRYDLMGTIGVVPMDDRTIDKLADDLGESWPAVAPHVGFDEADIANITQVVSEADRARHMLRAHRETHGGFVRKEELKIGFQKAGRFDLLKSLGTEVLDIATINKVASLLDGNWREVALFLGLDLSDGEMILAKESDPEKQAKTMLFLWMERYTEANLVEYLARALITAELGYIAEELVPLLQLQPCDSCGNDDPCKFRRYFSKDNEGSTRLIGICCGSCGQEWLQERFLFHPDIDNTRPTRQLGDALLKKQLKVPIEKNPAFQVKGPRTKITDFDSIDVHLKVGDHITWQRPYVIWHHAIVSDINSKTGMIKVIHWNKTEWGCGSEQIMECWMDLREQKGQLFRIDYPEQFTTNNPPELVIARAKSRLGESGYGLLGDNCEAFASYCQTGVSESSQVVWFYNKLMGILKSQLGNIVGVVVREFASMTFRELMSVPVAETIEELGSCTNEAGVAIIIFIEGMACVWDLSEFYKARKSGEISRKDFLATLTKRITEAICAAGLATVGSGGLIIPAVGFAGFVGSICLGVIGSVVGKAAGSFIGPYLGRAVASMIGADDTAVTIDDLNPGDQVVFYGNSLHPRHHVIVVHTFPAKRKVKVIHNTYKNGVVEEIVEFTEPAYRLVYDEAKCNPPEEVLKRAISKIGDDTYRYSLAWNNCKTFAKWCKLKC